ncbi:MAG: DUF3782 domain-containing protein [Candidatus Tectomicrobia bacterium]|nr:DUF3782 domain-containing protein [Candidatus Tectomicrobia bacterium]
MAFEDLREIVRNLAEAQARTEIQINKLTRTVDELAQAQVQTEARVGRLELAVERLAEAQVQTEARVGRLELAVERLAEAQVQTEARVGRLELAVERLVEAQVQTEARVGRLELAVERLAEAQVRTEMRVEELAQAQTRTENELTQFRRIFTMQTGGLGARWGLQTEEAFRQGMRTILQEVGFTTEHFLAYDTAGEVFGQPDQIELDVVVRDGKVIVIEIKSALDRGQTHLFNRKVEFYARQTGRSVNRKLIVTPYADTRAKELALRLGVEICTDVTALS